jgi:tRNA pseudouridine13 synthase
VFVDLQSGDNVEDGECDATADPSRALESFRLLCGEVDYDALRGFLERVSEGGDADLSPIILSADADKAHRSVSLVVPNVVSVNAWMICVSPALL